MGAGVFPEQACSLGRAESLRSCKGHDILEPGLILIGDLNLRRCRRIGLKFNTLIATF